MSKVYTALPLDEDGGVTHRPGRLSSPLGTLRTALFVAIPVVASFILGYVLGQNSSAEASTSRLQPGTDGLMPPQAFIPKSTENARTTCSNDTDNLLQ